MDEREFWSEISADSLVTAGRREGRSMSRPGEEAGDEAVYERFMAGLRLEPSQLVTRQPDLEDPDERAHAAFIHAAGGVPWSARRP